MLHNVFLYLDIFSKLWINFGDCNKDGQSADMGKCSAHSIVHFWQADDFKTFLFKLLFQLFVYFSSSFRQYWSYNVTKAACLNLFLAQKETNL